MRDLKDDHRELSGNVTSIIVRLLAPNLCATETFSLTIPQRPPTSRKLFPLNYQRDEIIARIIHGNTPHHTKLDSKTTP